MNDLTDIIEIVENYYIKGGRLLKNGDAEHAERLFEQGLSKLKTLKLTPADRRNLRLLRNAFELAIKAARALQKGQNNKAIILAEQGGNYAYRYNAAIIARAVSDDGK